MYYLGSPSNEPPIGRLAVGIWIVGLLAVPALSLCFVRLLGLAGVVADRPADDAATWIWLGGWAAGNVLWVLLVYRVDAWDEERCAQRRTCAQGPVLLRRRNRLLVDGASSRPRQIAWCGLGLRIGIVLYPAAVGLCLYAAHGFVTIEDTATSVGPQPLVAIGLLIAAIVLVSIAVNGLYERAHMVRHGCLLRATVTFAGLRDAADGSPALHVDYRFRTPAGEWRAGSECLSCRPRRMPVPGEHLVVLYDERLGAQVM